MDEPNGDDAAEDIFFSCSGSFNKQSEGVVSNPAGNNNNNDDGCQRRIRRHHHNPLQCNFEVGSHLL